MSCEYAGRENPRTLPGRHVEDCHRESCPGCQPCTEPHCRICGIAHADGTCAECLAETREALREIARMCDALPDEVEYRGVNGEAMMLLGPAADPEARGHVEASIAAGRLPADYLDDADSELHPLFVLGTWDMCWRDALEHDEPTERLTIAAAVDYLDRQMSYMGGFEHVPFEDFASDLRSCGAHLEAVLHDGEQVERGAPCHECKRPLTRVWADDVKGDGWVCNTRSCIVEGYTLAQYRAWVEDAHRKSASRLTAADMALRFDIKPNVVRVWGHRELIRKRGTDPATGLTLYDVGDVATRLAEKDAARDACQVPVRCVKM